MSDSPNMAPPAPPAPPTPPMAPGAPMPSDTGKLLAGLGYPIPILALVALLMDPYKNERFVRAHAIQALGLAVALIVLEVFAVVPIVGWVISVLAWFGWAAFAIMGLINGLQGKPYEVPYLYGFVKSYIDQA